MKIIETKTNDSNVTTYYKKNWESNLRVEKIQESGRSMYWALNRNQALGYCETLEEAVKSVEDHDANIKKTLEIYKKARREYDNAFNAFDDYGQEEDCEEADEAYKAYKDAEEVYKEACR